MESKVKIVQRCWDEALKSFGTAYIFEQRVNKLGRRLKLLTFLGIAVPVVVGSIYLSFGTTFSSVLIPIAGVLGTVQLITSTWSLVAKWEDNYGYTFESITANHQLSREYQKLAENPDLSDFPLRFEVLEAEGFDRRNLDYKQGITEEEKRAGMRAGLRKFERPCAGCGEVPQTLEPSNCNVCGSFKRIVL